MSTARVIPLLALWTITLADTVPQQQRSTLRHTQAATAESTAFLGERKPALQTPQYTSSIQVTTLHPQTSESHPMLHQLSLASSLSKMSLSILLFLSSVTAVIIGLFAQSKSAQASSMSRRGVLCSTAAAATALLVKDPPPAQAALVQFPPAQLKNVYYLMRAGVSPVEERGILLTNPVLATQISTNGLSRTGRQQVIQALEALRARGLEDEVVWLWPSITARCYDTAEILAQGLGIGRNRLVPEYSFLNARAVGAYERQSVEKMAEIYASDTIDANIRPPPFTDGTPNESAADVLVRGAQLLSKLETQYSGVTIIIIAPDSDNLSIMQAALTGVDLREHYRLAFAPGEVRAIDLTRRFAESA